MEAFEDEHEPALVPDEPGGADELDCQDDPGGAAAANGVDGDAGAVGLFVGQEDADAGDGFVLGMAGAAAAGGAAPSGASCSAAGDATSYLDRERECYQRCLAVALELGNRRVATDMRTNLKRLSKLKKGTASALGSHLQKCADERHEKILTLRTCCCFRNCF